MMTAKILKGRPVADEIEKYVKQDVDIIKSIGGDVTIAVIQVGDDQASNTYVRNKEKACERCGINTITERFDADMDWSTLEPELIEYINHLNANNDITGILVQLPLPDMIREDAVLQTIWSCKDVDGFKYENAGKLYTGANIFDVYPLEPCTARGVMHMLHHYDIPISGKNCVVVGRSNIVGKPVASMLLDCDGTVTVCHSKTKNLKDICKQADILVCAIGQPKFFTREYIKNGAVVIDVGMNRDENGKLCGDVDFDDVVEIAGAITPVPGGCGLLTVAQLMENCVNAWYIQNSNYRKGMW